MQSALAVKTTLLTDLLTIVPTTEVAVDYLIPIVNLPVAEAENFLGKTIISNLIFPVAAVSSITWKSESNYKTVVPFITLTKAE